MKFSVVNLGCKVNRVESDSYEKILRVKGCVQVEQDADFVVVNTCTVTGVAEKKTRKAVRQVLKNNPHARVLVTGCAVAINPSVFEEMSDRVEVCSKADSFARIEAMDFVGGGRVAYANFTEPSVKDSPRSTRTRVGVKVQDGCDNACTYCIVHVARGAATSRPIEEIRQEVASLARTGVKEIVLSGINIGSYHYGDMSLTELLEDLLKLTEDLTEPGIPPVRFRVSSVEPMDLSDSFIKLLALSEGRICRHLHLPLQAGSSKVLREMARPYDAEDFKALVDYLRAEVPSISLSTDIIVGFPGESDEEFEETLQLAKYCGFSKIHVFPYSLREGTPAAQRADQVPPDVKSERASRLRELGDALRRDDYIARAGMCEYVLVEQQGRAMTESYYEIEVPRELERGTLVAVALPSEPCFDCQLAD